jgi:hypothetical protein
MVQLGLNLKLDNSGVGGSGVVVHEVTSVELFWSGEGNSDVIWLRITLGLI